MKIKDVSIVPGFGSQVVVALWEKDNSDDVVEPGHERWPRWKAAAKQLVEEVKEQENVEISGELVRVDLKQYVGSLLLVQFSYKNPDEIKTLCQSA